MADIMSAKERSTRMQRIRSKNTKPELLVRKLLYGMGFRYRLHVKELPGKPDLVFLRRKKVIFVNGCFWHFHQNCRDGKIPESRRDYWAPKLERNRQRDLMNIAKLEEQGWRVHVIWECELKKLNAAIVKAKQFLDDG